jgi:O-methyltransferase involved in polyketide biosynthesis
MAADWNKKLWQPHLKQYYDWRTQASTAIRTKIFDQVAQAQINTYNAPTIIELGAGFSTRYYRLNNSKKATWFQSDFPAVINQRKELEVETPTYRLLDSPLSEVNWLNQASFDQQTLIIAEGVLMYLKPAQVEQLISQLRDRVSGATLLFDTMGKIYDNKGKSRDSYQWFADITDLEALDLTILSYWQMLEQHPKRWKYLRWLSFIPACKQANLYVKACL